MFTHRVAKLFKLSLAGLVVVGVLVSSLVTGAARAQDANETPEDAAAAYYTWYLDYIGVGEDFRNPMVDGAYRDSDLLTGDFIAAIDEFLAADSPMNNYDPFLCAQDVPRRFTVGPAQMSADEQAASLTVWTSFVGYHAFTVHLAQGASGWQIADVVCDAERTPAGVVSAFYTWYLAYNAWDGMGDRPNALSDGAYGFTGLLSADFVAQLDASLAASPGLGADPFLCAQDIPDSVRVLPAADASPAGDSEAADADAADAADEADENVGPVEVAVETSFADHGFSVSVVLVDEQWVIDAVNCPAVSD